MKLKGHQYIEYPNISLPSKYIYFRLLYISIGLRPHTHYIDYT